MTTSTKPKFSIIIVALNGIIHTTRCIESIFKNTQDYELILVENCSTDGTKEYFDSLGNRGPVVKVVNNDTPSTFSENNNLGLGLAEGEFVIFLNNDTEVGPNWLDRMYSHFENVPVSNIGAVGPVSSNSNGKQMVGLQNSEQWYAENRGRWVHTGILYGWCLMVRKSIFDEVGGFNTQLKNAYDDNDLCLRIQLAGYKLIIAADTYIYHKGQSTFMQYTDVEGYNKNGIVNRAKYFEMWKDPEPKKKKLVAVYRTNWGSWLEKSLEQTSKFADSIVIHFCRAPKMLGDLSREKAEADLRKRFPKIVHVEYYDGIFQEDYERGRLLEIAQEMREKGEADWCISVDDDELYEDKFVDIVQKLMTPHNPEVLGYWCQWRTIWDARLGKEYYRTDSTFGSFSNYRFFRLLPKQEIMSKHPEGHHCGSAPWIAPENLRWINVRVKHMGYDTPEQRQKKFEFYQANDHFKTKEDIGYEDYSHLISLNPKLQEYDKDHGISLLVMVKNEEEFILGMLENVQYLVDEMVIVDTGSTDKTIEEIEYFAAHSHVPVKLLRYTWEDIFSTPRNYAKLHCTKKKILFLDADERFKPEGIHDVWATSEMDLDVVTFDVVNFLTKATATAPASVAPTVSARLFRNIPEFYFTGIIHETIDDSAVVYQRQHNIKSGLASVNLFHYGYLKEKKIVAGKCEYYERLNKRQIEISEGKDPRPFFNLALHYIEDNREAEAVMMIQDCLKLAPRFYHASQHMAALNIQSAKHFLRESLKYMPEYHALKPSMMETLQFLETKTQGFTKVGV